MIIQVVIQQGALMLERLYPLHVFARLPGNEEDFWETKGLGVADWAGLAGLMYADIFSLDFLQPLDDSDTKFRLEPHPGVDLSRYTDMVHSTELGGINGPDLLGAVYAPRGNIQVHSPYLEVSAFNPRAKQASNSKKSDKRWYNIIIIILIMMLIHNGKKNEGNVYEKKFFFFFQRHQRFINVY